ncbi:MAG: zf-HC2 domain-containing protein [Bryobacteraceae bacterium]|jgi:anti-sigma factor RsiW
MSCDAFEKLIALDAGGDLAPAEAARVEAHIETCASCRELARSLQESHAALKALSDTALDENALAPWRRGLLGRIETEPHRRVFAWRWAWAAAAAMALLALLAVPRHAPPTPAPLARLTPPSIAAAPPLPAPVHRRPRHRRAPAPAPETLLVKLETPDPNVVIYWIVEGKGN